MDTCLSYSSSQGEGNLKFCEKISGCCWMLLVNLCVSGCIYDHALSYSKLDLCICLLSLVHRWILSFVLLHLLHTLCEATSLLATSFLATSLLATCTWQWPQQHVQATSKFTASCQVKKWFPYVVDSGGKRQFALTRSPTGSGYLPAYLQVGHHMRTQHMFLVCSLPFEVNIFLIIQPVNMQALL